MQVPGGALSNFAAVATGKTPMKAHAEEQIKDRAVPTAGDPQGQEAPDLQALDDEEEEESKTFMEIVEENAFAIEAFLYFVFLVLFTIYAVGAQGNSNEQFAMREQIRRIYAPFLHVGDATSWFAFMQGFYINATYPTEVRFGCEGINEVCVPAG